MKRIVLVRHATAVDTGPQGSDFHRRLKKRGRREAALMAERAAAAVGSPDLMITSPADRAVETARAFAGRLGYPVERVVVRENLYGGLLPDEFLRVVHAVDDAHASIMIFGHDPSFSEFTSYLVRDFKGLIPKAGFVVIETERRSWRRIRRGDGRLVTFQSPPEPEAQRRAEEELLERLAADVRTVVFTVLRGFGIPDNREVVKTVARAGARIAREVRVFATLEPGPAEKPRARRARAKGRRRASRGDRA